MTVQTDDGRSVYYDLKDYNRIDHGYAATIHKAQGMTVDRFHVLATLGMHAHSSYVVLSRHRDGMELHYGSSRALLPVHGVGLCLILAYLGERCSSIDAVARLRPISPATSPAI